jgi:hypothetical protein
MTEIKPDESGLPLPISNPFSTRFVRPDAMEFRFAPGPKLRQIIHRLWDKGCWGQIVGPHGSGKSTMVAMLSRHASSYGIRAVPFTLHDDQRRMPAGWKRTVWEAFERGRSTMVVVDGYEQLSRFSRWRLSHICRTSGWGLLVTAHAPVGLPMLYRTSTNVELAEMLVAMLLDGYDSSIDHKIIRDAYHRHDGNLRMVFRDLFDHYEQTRS